MTKLILAPEDRFDFGRFDGSPVEDAERRGTWFRAAHAYGLVAGLLFAVFGGFLEFVGSLPRSADLPPQSDGIVVLTGGEARLSAGVQLLAEGLGTRLLVSGVHPETSLDDLRDLMAPEDTAAFECCVDLDKAATDTTSNATETAHWTRQKGYNSIILVTATYHMPRSLLELERRLPGVRVEAYPVFPDAFRLDDWWRRPGTLKLLIGEYVKYGVALARIRLARLD
jgi:uncharacterized SAM-binding protein YcdF (DUF218 family)